LNWIDELKIAIVNEQFDKIVALYELMPDFQTIEQMQEASALIEMAIKMLENEKNQLSKAMNRNKVAGKYKNGIVGYPYLDKIS
jgi:hydroxylamine reductase (hybrid-cluster protein)